MSISSQPRKGLTWSLMLLVAITCGLKNSAPKPPLKELTLLLSVLATIYFSGLITQAHSDSLDSAVIKALSSNPQLNSSKLGVLQAQEGVSRAQSAWKPDVRLNIRGGAKQSTTNTPTSNSSTDTFTPLSATVSLSQHVLDFGETKSAIKKTEIQKQISEEQLRKATQTVIKESIEAYLALWRDSHLLTVAETNEYNLQKQFLAAQKRFALREVTRTDLSQAQARLQNAVSRTIGAEIAVENSLAKYRKIIGPLETRSQISWSREKVARYPTPISLEEARTISYSANSDMKIARLQQELARHTIFEQRSTRLPKISVEASVSGSRNPSQSVDTSRNISLEGVLSVPLYDAGISRSNLDSAKLQVQISIENERQIKLELNQKLLSLWNTLIQVGSQISSLMESVEANKTALVGVQREVEVGTRTTLNLLDAENEYIRAESSLVLAIFDEAQTHFDLHFECGLLDEELFAAHIH